VQFDSLSSPEKFLFDGMTILNSQAGRYSGGVFVSDNRATCIEVNHILKEKMPKTKGAKI
jgi:hypothetical protein